jgi:hypothetical protein
VALFDVGKLPTKIQEADGDFGINLEIVNRNGHGEPLAVISRIWDPDARRPATMVAVAGWTLLTVDSPTHMEAQGFTMLGPREAPILAFVRTDA